MNSLILAWLLVVYKRKGIDFTDRLQDAAALVCVCVLYGEGKKIIGKGG